jgi:hypothetical protein
MTKLKEKALELAEIAKECPENLQVREHKGVRNHFLDGSGTWRGRIWPGMVPGTFPRPD